MSPTEIEATFRQWWSESYPMTPPNKQTVSMHVAFALHVLDTAQMYEEYTKPSATND